MHTNDWNIWRITKSKEIPTAFDRNTWEKCILIMIQRHLNEWNKVEENCITIKQMMNDRHKNAPNTGRIFVISTASEASVYVCIATV